MKTQYYTASSLDGFIATEDHSLEWLFQLGDINDTGYPEFIKEVGALAMGSSTYEWMLRHVIKPARSRVHLGRTPNPPGCSQPVPYHACPKQTCTSCEAMSGPFTPR